MREDGPRRIGLFGGTFDPIHFGHLKMAEASIAACGLERVYFIPCRVPPHKDVDGITPSHHRYAMVALATDGDRHFIPSPVELSSGGMSYTIRTVKWFQRSLGPDAEIFFIMGTDSFEELETWKDYRDLMNRCHLILFPRGDGAMEPENLMLPDGADQRIVGVDPGARSPAEGKENGKTVCLLEAEPIAISSTVIRRRLALGQPVEQLVPRDVVSYIRKTGLYR